MQIVRKRKQARFPEKNSVNNSGDENSRWNENMKENEILQAAIFLLIAFFLVNALIPFVTGSEKPLIVLSGSMTPMMLPGDMIIVKSVDPNELKVGDVLAFQLPGENLIPW